MTDNDAALAAIREATKGHMPGPWDVKKYPEYQAGCRDIVGPKYKVAWTEGLGDDSEDMANAALIAAAPALLHRLDAQAERIAALERERDAAVGYHATEYDRMQAQRVVIEEGGSKLDRQDTRLFAFAVDMVLKLDRQTRAYGECRKEAAALRAELERRRVNEKELRDQCNRWHARVATLEAALIDARVALTYDGADERKMARLLIQQVLDKPRAALGPQAATSGATGAEPQVPPLYLEAAAHVLRIHWRGDEAAPDTGAWHMPDGCVTDDMAEALAHWVPTEDEPQSAPALSHLEAERAYWGGSNDAIDKSSRAAHVHCWHGTGRQYATMPPRWDEVCCHCGETRCVTAPVERREEHGPHMPPTGGVP
jgi:hypothetical protein